MASRDRPGKEPKKKPMDKSAKQKLQPLMEPPIERRGRQAEAQAAARGHRRELSEGGHEAARIGSHQQAAGVAGNDRLVVGR